MSELIPEDTCWSSDPRPIRAVTQGRQADKQHVHLTVPLAVSGAQHFTLPIECTSLYMSGDVR